MKTETRRNLLLALVFLAGCAVSRVQWVPPALAQTDTGIPRWDYYCTWVEGGPGQSTPEVTTAQLKAAGLQGWELAHAEGMLHCFKRPLR
ncbi:hypothetical protein ACN28I_34055 [Archangium gephyra]|uniref:hypothetical protein n=1 Tax=Archangium gephyra TaxID=48 RepID=UPI003B78431E